MHTCIQNRPGGRHDWLYRWTLYTHTGASVRQLRDGKSRIVVHLVVAKINLSKREKAVKDAVCDVCAQFDREQVPALPVRNEMPWGSDSMASAFASNMRSSVMRRGHASDRGGAVYAFRFACMHPYASGDAYIFSFRFGLVPTFRGWSGRVYALYASFPYRGFEKKERNPLY